MAKKKKKRKKKVLPDHGPLVRESSHYVPTQEEARTLKKQFGITRNFRLRDHLESAFMFVESVQTTNQQTPTVAQQRRMLQELRDRCESLKEVLTKIGISEKKHLWKYPEGSEENLSRFHDQTDAIYWVTLCALRDVEGMRGSRGKDPVQRNFIHKLVDVWSKGTKTEPKIIHTRSPDAYGGDFLDFLVACYKMGGIRYHSKNALGKTAQRALKSRDKSKPK